MNTEEFTALEGFYFHFFLRKTLIFFGVDSKRVHCFIFRPFRASQTHTFVSQLDAFDA